MINKIINEDLELNAKNIANNIKYVVENILIEKALKENLLNKVKTNIKQYNIMKIKNK